MILSIVTVEISIHPPIVFHIGIMYWVLVEIIEILQYPKKIVKIRHQTRQLDLVYFDTYQSDKIIVSTP